VANYGLLTDLPTGTAYMACLFMPSADLFQLLYSTYVTGSNLFAGEKVQSEYCMWTPLAKQM
jgi:hypothetical protein